MIIVVAYPDRGAGNDPKLFFFGGGGVGGSLSLPRLNIFTAGNMGVMICLSQGGLRSLSASSYKYVNNKVLVKTSFIVIFLFAKIRIKFITHFNNRFFICKRDWDFSNLQITLIPFKFKVA